MLSIKNAGIFTPATYIEEGAVLIDQGIIVEVGKTNEVVIENTFEEIDARGLYLVPGFTDLQINGAFGNDFTSDPESIWKAAERLPKYGVTTFLPTILSPPLETIAHARKVLAQGRSGERKGASPFGLHIEGPFLNPQKRGAHPRQNLCLPDTEQVKGFSPHQKIGMVTLAPELPGALEVISTLAERGVVVSAGHSCATYDQAFAGIKAGITYGTHLFNAMPTFESRSPGLVGALLDESGIRLGIINDGLHVHPAVVSLIWKMAGSGRITLVSDATSGLGMRSGKYQLASEEIIVDEKSSRLKDGRLAGSVLSLDRAIRNLISFTGCSLAAALSAVTTTPAELLGRSNRFGRIEPGLQADLVIMTPELQVVKTIIGGELVYTSDEASE